MCIRIGIYTCVSTQHVKAQSEATAANAYDGRSGHEESNRNGGSGAGTRITDRYRMPGHGLVPSLSWERFAQK